MNKVNKKIFLCSFFALYCLSTQGCCENSLVRSEFKKLSKNDFENDLKKIDKFKKSAQNEKAYLQNKKAAIIEKMEYGYKRIIEDMRLEIENIDVMLLVLDKIEGYRQNVDPQKKVEIESALWEYADYYPVVRSLVKEVVNPEIDSSTGSSNNSSEEKKKEGVAADGENITNFNALNKVFSKTEYVKLTGKEKDI